MKKYGILVVGCGYIGCEHISDIYYREDIDLIAVVDQRIERAEETAKKYGAEKFGNDYLEFLTDERIDIVIIATYPDTHLSITRDCINYGKHVLCEKPIAKNKVEAEEFSKLMETTNCKVQIAHILRHNRSYNKLKELIDAKVIGDLRVIRMVQNQHAVNWERYKALLDNCMPVVDCGVHYIDIVRWFTNSDIKRVSGFGTKIDEDSPRYNYTFMNFETNNGCCGYYESGWSRNIGAENIKEFIGTKGRITLTLENHRGDCLADGDLICIHKDDSMGYEAINCHSRYKDMYAQLHSLINSIENNTDTVPSWKDVWEAQKVALAAEKAILTGNSVDIV